tara:strand:- start:16169 stop:16480 length:312 start_codon:yes stop_codon:yes gene_type:complete
MKVRFSLLSVLKLEKLLEYLEQEWAEDSKNKFLKDLNTKLDSIKENPKAFPASTLEPKVRKCVVTRQTTILYEIQDDSIFILTVVDNRQDPDKIKKEIKKHFG